jgi:hypothetical protein
MSFTNDYALTPRFAGTVYRVKNCARIEIAYSYGVYKQACRDCPRLQYKQISGIYRLCPDLSASYGARKMLRSGLSFPASLRPYP